MKTELVKVLLQYFQLNLEEPFRLKSGMLSPIYFDARKLFGSHIARHLVISEFFAFFARNNASCVIGIPTAGYPWAALTADRLDLQFDYVSEENKPDLKELIEKLQPLERAKIGVIDDVHTTGLSLLKGIEILREVGAKDFLIKTIFSYGSESAGQALAEAGLQDLPSLIDLNDMLEPLKEKFNLSGGECEKLRNFYLEPEGWASEYGYAQN